SLYGRAACIRSCALRILDAATISIALVIFFVFSTLLILPRISLPAAMSVYSFATVRSKRFLEISNRVSQCSFVVFLELLGVFDLLQQCCVARLHEAVQT